MFRSICIFKKHLLLSYQPVSVNSRIQHIQFFLYLLVYLFILFISECSSFLTYVHTSSFNSNYVIKELYTNKHKVTCNDLPDISGNEYSSEMCACRVLFIFSGFLCQNFWFWGNVQFSWLCKFSLLAGEISSQKRRKMHPRLNRTASPLIRDQL